MPKVSVIIPTYNRPDLLPKAVQSVLNQTYQDFEIIVVDDGQEKSAENIIRQFSNKRIRYIKHKERRGGSAARNTGIKNSQGKYIAFLDDDDEWVAEKLEIQTKQFEKTSDDVGFCFSAVKNIYGDKEQISFVPEGVGDYFEMALKKMKGFLTVTLIIKRNVFGKVGLFDEKFPSHQEPDLMIRVSKNFKGLGINKPLVSINMSDDHERIGSSLARRISGRKMILEKYFDDFRKRPQILAQHYFWLGLMLRDNQEYGEARNYFKKSWKLKFSWRVFLHYLFNCFRA
ncbi:MAG: glycosyltransferase family 2 protein [bacterium]